MNGDANAYKIERPDIFSYDNFRKYIGDAMDYLCAVDPRCSLRSISKEVGFKSSGYLKTIVDGKRNLSDHTSIKLKDVFAWVS